MKKYIKTFIVSSLICLLVFSCRNNENLQNKESKSDSFDSSAFISGSWINEQYFKDIKAKKSPRDAQSGGRFLYLPSNNLQKVYFLEDFHSGGDDFWKIVKANNTIEVWNCSDDSLLSMKSKIQLNPDHSILFDKVRYVKIDNPMILQNETFYPEYILNTILFSGEYSDSKGNKIKFLSNGEIQGLENTLFYKPIIDYYASGLEVNQINLGRAKDQLKTYGFRFNDNIFEIYELKKLYPADINNPAVGFGELKFKLIKTK